MQYEHRLAIIMFFAVSLSLSFSAVGHNVYIAPAIPFLSILLLNKRLLCNIIYPIGSLIIGNILLSI